MAGSAPSTTSARTGVWRGQEEEEEVGCAAAPGGADSDRP